MSNTVLLTAPNGVQISQPIGLFIDNQFVASSDLSMLDTLDPSNGEKITSVCSATEHDVDTAVLAARRAFQNPAWRDLDPSARGRLIFKLADLVEANSEALATLESWDAGHPWNDALYGDVAEFVSTLRYYAGYSDKIYGQSIPIGSSRLAYTVRQPLGVCGQIIPWNFPLGMAAWKLGPALACGNTVVLKPAEQTPLSILFVASLIKEAGFPPGVINIVNGPGATTGSAIAGHSGIDKIAFTGSTATARKVMTLAAGNLKNITLETGGKSPFVVFANADLKKAAQWATIGSMANMGQVCTSTNRILVEDSIYDAFLQLFKAEIASTIVMGDVFDTDTTHGPQISRAQYERVLSYVDSAKAEGATLECGGVTGNIGSGKGYYIQPTVFSGVSSTMKVYREEIFGPFAVVARFTSEEQALAMANDSTYGLAASVWTQDVALAHRFANRTEAGMVWINSAIDSDVRVPFGGVKQSGIGRECGQAGLDAYSTVKSVYVSLEPTAAS